MILIYYTHDIDIFISFIYVKSILNMRLILVCIVFILCVIIKIGLIFLFHKNIKYMNVESMSNKIVSNIVTANKRNLLKKHVNFMHHQE